MNIYINNKKYKLIPANINDPICTKCIFFTNTVRNCPHATVTMPAAAGTWKNSRLLCVLEGGYFIKALEQVLKEL